MAPGISLVELHRALCLPPRRQTDGRWQSLKLIGELEHHHVSMNDRQIGNGRSSSMRISIYVYIYIYTYLCIYIYVYTYIIRVFTCEKGILNMNGKICKV